MKMQILRRLYRKYFLGITEWYYCNIYPTARIGKGTSIGSYCEIGNKVEIGTRCQIGAKCFIPEGVKIGNRVFVGPGTIFTNDKYPPSHRKDWKPIIVKSDASIGAGCTIVCGVTIGKNARVGAGAVVTKTIPDNQLRKGNPAK